MRYLLLTYNAPGGQEIWAAMTESERRAEEDEIRTARESHAREQPLFSCE
jgi:hypothetical protein